MLRTNQLGGELREDSYCDCMKTSYYYCMKVSYCNCMRTKRALLCPIYVCHRCTKVPTGLMLLRRLQSPPASPERG